MGIEHDEQIGSLMAIRLKQAREAAGLTQVQSAELSGINRNSIVNYEKPTAPANRNCANLGMEARNLRTLASLYNVSTDYLLGLTDTRSRSADVQTACKVTGLSEESIEMLRRCKDESDSALIFDMVNDFISFAFDTSDPDNGQPFVNYICFRECADIYRNKATAVITSDDPVSIYRKMKNEMEYLMTGSNFFPLPYHEATALFRTIFCDRLKRYLEEQYPLEVTKNGND